MRMVDRSLESGLPSLAINCGSTHSTTKRMLWSRTSDRPLRRSATQRSQYVTRMGEGLMHGPKKHTRLFLNPECKIGSWKDAQAFRRRLGACETLTTAREVHGLLSPQTTVAYDPYKKCGELESPWISGSYAQYLVRGLLNNQRLTNRSAESDSSSNFVSNGTCASSARSFFVTLLFRTPTCSHNRLILLA